MRGRIYLSILLMASIAVFTACESKPQTIHFGSEDCAYCRMMITEPEYASQILNKHGRAYSFDSIECMAAYDIRNDATAEMDIHSRWVPDFEGNTGWLPAEEAFYLHSETLRSPMGLFLSAYPNNHTADSFKSAFQGDILTYDGVKQLVINEWNPASRTADSHQHH